MTDITTTSVVGIGKLGAPLAACLAARGYQVVAADTDAAKVAALGRGEAPVFEPGLAEMLAEHKAKIRATQDVAEAVKASQITFIVVPTPSGADGEFSLQFTLAACHEIGRALRDKP
ncbi:MAG: NAD(P)-binding domain-containing protein, partial [Armatimonadota bacterium]|nr:NAD(P)-binding domain-containing protein [Armatimonadota bacterium]